ncbi:MAG: hypothetical protein U5O39_15880 [Gammaproteobacteria bacterium]|nr:hypothetical protein [Gammaproteobacteria bacterium]
MPTRGPEPVEIEGRFLVTDNLEITAGYAYNDTEIDDNDLIVAPCRRCTVRDPARFEWLRPRRRQSISERAEVHFQRDR